MKPARLPHRFIASVIDLFIVGLIWAAVMSVMVLVVLTTFSAQIGEMSADPEGLATNPFFILTTFLMVILTYSLSFHTYFITMESKSGQTVGKKMMRIKVVSLDGSPITKRQAIYRDFVKVYFELTLTLPLLYIFMNEKRQRLGDKWAKTLVIEHVEQNS